ncbi:MAG: regulatory protein RecX [Spirochaetales bacterium]|nr:regulatory protein RecX [Spirochaetales bacterium]
MDNAEPGENSSSPRGNIYILSIKKAAVGPFEQIEVSDGSSFFIHRLFPPLFSCAAGTELSAEALQELSSLSETGIAWEKALDLLERRSHSRQELRLKLLKRGFSEIVSNQVLSLLEEKGFMDEASFAEQWVLSRLSRHPEGYRVLLSALKRKGVAGDVAVEALRKVFPDTEAREALKRLYEKAERKNLTDEEKEKLAWKKGFRSHIIRSYEEKD